jgi:hypothetical protein
MNVFPQNIQPSSYAIPEAAYSLKRPNLGDRQVDFAS